MISAIFSLLCVYLAWWMFSQQLRSLLYSEWTVKPFTTWEHVTGAVKHIFKQLSPQNLVAQGFVDHEIKFLNQRRSFMLLSFHRLAVVLPGLMLLSVLQIEMFVAVAVIGTILLAVFYKKPGRWLQVAFLSGVFFACYQWCFYQISQWIFFPDVNSPAYTFADGRIGTVLCFLCASIVLTLVLRMEYWSLWLASLFFFTGGIATLNYIGIILGEALGWGVYWFLKSRKSSKKNQIIFREMFLITTVSALLFLITMAYFKSAGLLDIRIMGPIFDKRILLLVIWAAWEIFLTCLLSLWGHFRSQNLIGETTDLESIKLPASVFCRGWLPDQKEFRRGEIERRLKSLEGFESQSGVVPQVLMQKSRLEVESLKQLLGALR